MPGVNGEQKRIESWFLAAARNAGMPIPSGELAGEEPDFRFQTTSGALGIELTEVLRPASSNHGIIPVEEESFHRAIIETAQRDYYTMPNANPVHVGVYFTNAKGKRRSKHELASTLSKFVQANVHRPTRLRLSSTRKLQMVSTRLLLSQSQIPEIGGAAKLAVLRWPIFAPRLKHE